jgi:hypothetical protein
LMVWQPDKSRRAAILMPLLLMQAYAL